jgi:hypothetical protein
MMPDCTIGYFCLHHQAIHSASAVFAPLVRVGTKAIHITTCDTRGRHIAESVSPSPRAGQISIRKSKPQALLVASNAAATEISFCLGKKCVAQDM